MSFLHQDIEILKKYGTSVKIPSYIQDNLNPAFGLRPYQIAAFENFIMYFENPLLRRKPSQTLFHMATGSGKTLIMAGLMLYLYKKGYRNFLFFVNLDNIVKKTEENFLNSSSSKFLFADEIRIDGIRVQINKVANFQEPDEDSINICFTTIQGLHSTIDNAKENSLSIADFESTKVVLISDEAHHLNVDTKTLKKDKDERELHHNWEQTVRRIVSANTENVLLEFTATCDLKNPLIKAEYEKKIIFDYPLSKFRKDGYSKEIKTLRTDVSVIERVIQALMLSQYRLKVFQDNRLSIKPVILFKAYNIKDSIKFQKTFSEMLFGLTGSELERISTLTDNSTLNEAYGYFRKNGISFEQLAQELKEDFSPEHCISANDEMEAGERQILLNSLEDKSNPYRAVFEVKKLDEGWDVLNLFDIVRLYETRQSGGKTISSYTISEAQLIGRGARYCPFQISIEQERFKRKYDNDIDNPLRICEELYYHCQNDSRYIGELNNALRNIGVNLDDVVICEYVLKESFKKEKLYQDGLVFVNERVVKDRKEVLGLLPSVRDYIYNVRIATGSSGEDTIFESEKPSEQNTTTFKYETTIGKIAEINYSIVHKAVRQYKALNFNTLHSQFPRLTSLREFIMDENYLGNIKIIIESIHEKPSTSILYTACLDVIGQVSEKIASIEELYEGTKKFEARRIRDIFKDKKCTYTVAHDGGLGYSQNHPTVNDPWQIDLSKEDWFAFEDNFGTSEEKAFVAFFRDYAKKLKEKYDRVYLVRNERQLHIYSFDGGERYEPDYVIFLQNDNTDGYEQLQIFVEPKGGHLLIRDKWKEDALLQLKGNAIPSKKLEDNNDYSIWGFHFYNHDEKMKEFEADFKTIFVNQNSK